MDRVKETSFVIKQLNDLFEDVIKDYEFIKIVCSYFDVIKEEELTPSDLKFLKYISNMAGVPHYYDLLFSKFNHVESFNKYDLNTVSAMIYESTLHIDENIKIHRYQKEILNRYGLDKQNRFFLSATTSFGKTFLIYEIIKKMQYKSIVLIFPTIALLSENFEKIMTDKNYKFFHDKFLIHTLSEVDEDELGENNIFIYTPERYLSFIDKHPHYNIDFVFVDEIYKIDNEYLIDAINKENERDTAYKITLFHILSDIKDVLLVGPYIEFPEANNTKVNQSFNKFLDKNNFTVIDYNKFDIVNKTVHIIGKNGKFELDDKLTIDLEGYSGKKAGERLGKVVSDIRNIKENIIIYTSGPGTAEGQAKNIIEFSNYDGEISEALEQFIVHLENTYKKNDWSLIVALKNKIGIHHGMVPKYIQKEIIKLFNDGDIDVLVSTTTITEGVNTSAKNLIVLNSKKGKKVLKTFDAKNIAGRAGRFLYHYSGRVIIIDKKFQEILDGSDNEIKHKNYDELSTKDEIDYFITDDEFLSDEDREGRNKIKEEQIKRNIPDEVIQMYKAISYSDKMIVFDNIQKLSILDKQKLQEFIRKISYLSLDYDGFSVILSIIEPIVSNSNLKFLIETTALIRRGENRGKRYPILTYMLSAYLKNGFMGGIEYNLTRKKKLTHGSRNFTTDEAIRDTAKFVFSTLKYQLVKYLGVFNIMYKFSESENNKLPFDEVQGIEKLLMKLEYNAISQKGRLASDYGVPSKIIEYYDNEEQRDKIRKQFDIYEEEKFKKIEEIFLS